MRARELFIGQAARASDAFRLDFAARLRLGYNGLQLKSPTFPSYGTGRDGCEMRSAASRVTSALVVRSAVPAEILAAFKIKPRRPLSPVVSTVATIQP